MTDPGRSPAEDTRLGALLIRAGVLDADALARALDERPMGRRLGAWLVEAGLASQLDVDSALKEQLRDARLGQILLRIGAVDHAPLREALDAQTRSGRMLGELLIELGATDSEAVDWALAQQSAEKRTAALFQRRGLLNATQSELCFSILQEQPERQLTELMVELGFVTSEQVRETLRLKLQESRLGRLLVEEGTVSEAQLQFALAEQTVSGLMLGQVLIQLGICDVTAVSAALARQLLEV